MSGEQQSLAGCYAEAESLRSKLETFLNSNSPEFQHTIASAVTKYSECLQIAAQIALFSPNESLDDVSSRDLQYLLLHFHLGQLFARTNREERKATLLKARQAHEGYLNVLDQYDILSAADFKLLERYREDKDGFSITGGGSAADAAQRRDAKISRFREEKALKTKLDHLKRDPAALREDDDALRELRLTELRAATMQAFADLESIALEVQMLARAPPLEELERQREKGKQEADARMRGRPQDGYSERLDDSVASLLAGASGGPILSKDGRPMRPFTLLDSRQRLQAGVFRPDHSLPTMTIDEYLDEEKRRGGIIEGGGEASLQREVVDEDDLVRADADTVKAREWDEFKEANPRGAGNTMNMG